MSKAKDRNAICPGCDSLDVRLGEVITDGTFGYYCHSCDLSPHTGPVDLAWTEEGAWEEWTAFEKEHMT